MLRKTAGKKIVGIGLAVSILFSTIGTASAQKIDQVHETERPYETYAIQETAPQEVQTAADMEPIIVELNPEQTEQQEALQAIAQAVLGHQPTVDVTQYGLTEESLIHIMEVEMPTEYPMAMELDSYTYGMGVKDHLIKYINFVYPYHAAETAGRQAQTEQVIQTVLSGIDLALSDVEKVKAVHDYLVSTVAYDMDTLKNSPQTRTIYTAYGALVERKAVCQGYALAFQLFMQRLGIESVFVSSALMNHAWNMVKLDGNWYHVDCTWDDQYPDIPGQIQYGTFLVSDLRIADSQNQHYGWSPKDYPKAESTLYDRFDWNAAPVQQPEQKTEGTALRLDTAAYAGQQGSIYQFLALNSTGKQLMVSSSNAEVADVLLTNGEDPRGQLYTVRLLAPGDAKILVTDGSGGMAVMKVTVAASLAA